MLRRTFLACLVVAAFTATTTPVLAGGNGNGRGGGNGSSGGTGSQAGNGKGGGAGNGNASSNGNGSGASGGRGGGSANGSGKSADSEGKRTGRKTVDKRPAAAETPAKVDRSVFRVKHGNGFRETLSRGRYVLQDNRGRTIVDRVAMPKDYARLRRLSRPDS
jgi:hypothetical protein